VHETIVERYLNLGLRLGRHVDGIVDSYAGPPDIAAAVDAEPLREPGALASDAEQLLGELDDGWLRDQVRGLHTCAAFMADSPDSPGSYADEVEGCYGVRPAHTDEAVFEGAHRELDQLLPGDGPLAERYEKWRSSITVPADRIGDIVAALIEEAREWTRGVAPLPEGEGVDLEIVRDRSWLAFCEYRGGLRSRISVNADLPISAFELIHVTCHETYPGHHAERVCKDHLLVRGEGKLEETLVLMPTPQSLVSEGLAELGPELLLASEGAGRLTAVLAGAGIELDLAHALAVWRAREPCGWAEVNASLMLHGDGVGEAEVQAYLERWALMTPDFATHVIRFITEPSSRTYIVNYSAGRELCRSYVDGDPGQFRRLLTEQVRVSELR
jgi:hypothetical protein